MTDLTQIVPRLPPAIDGVGDYAWLLAQRLNSDAGLASRFLVTDPLCPIADGAEHLAAHTATALAEALGGRETVLLHFVNYAYQQRGCPWWLVHGLERWRRAQAQRRLLVMFHELYASGPPWSSAFWLSPVQRMIARRLCRLGDGAFTSLEAYARWLWGEARPLSTWPVPSNVGEPSAVPGLAEREPALVVFGRPSVRAQIYRDNAGQLRTLARTLGLRTLHDVGAAIASERLPGVDGLEVVPHGTLTAERVSALLLRCRVGLINNGDKPLGKSGVFASYCSHGLATLSCRGYPAADGLQSGREYLVSPPADAGALQPIASAAWDWYRGHHAGRLAQAVARELTADGCNGSAVQVAR